VSVSGPLRPAPVEKEGVPAGTVRLFPRAGAGVFAGNTGLLSYDAPPGGSGRHRRTATGRQALFRVYEDQERISG
jgi:hypothetical protein